MLLPAAELLFAAPDDSMADSITALETPLTARAQFRSAAIVPRYHIKQT